MQRSRLVGLDLRDLEEQYGCTNLVTSQWLRKTEVKKRSRDAHTDIHHTTAHCDGSPEQRKSPAERVCKEDYEHDAHDEFCEAVDASRK